MWPIGSSGPHSNGYSLVRRVVERSGLALSDNAPFAEGLSLGAALLTPTRLYVKSLMPLIKAGRIKGLAHITGGGLIENPPRMLPKHLTARIDYDSLDILPVFEWMAEVGGITPHEMRRTFNMGTGMLAAVPADDADAIVAELKAAGERAWVAGELATTEG